MPRSANKSRGQKSAPELLLKKNSNEVAAPCSTSPEAAKAVDLEELRNEITNLIAHEGMNLARAAVEEGKKGQLAMVKYLFEFAGLYPAPAKAGTVEPEEESLARTLLHRLGLSDEPATPSANDLRVNGRARDEDGVSL